MKNKRLLYMLIALAILLGIIYVIDDRPDAVTFDADLCSIDRLLVTEMSVLSSLSEEEISLVYDGELWHVSFSMQQYLADQSKINRILNIFTKLEAIRIVANHESSWAEFQLEAGQASSVSLSDGSKQLCKIYTGGLTYDHSRNMSNTYVRQQDDPKTYLVADNLRALIQVEPRAFISTRVSEAFQVGQVQSVVLNSYQIDNWALMQDPSNGSWTHENGTEVSAEKVNQYLRMISGLQLDQFDTDFDLANADPVHSITLEFTDQEPLIIHLYSTDEEHWHLTSSYRTDAVVFSTAGKPDLPDHLTREATYFME